MKMEEKTLWELFNLAEKNPDQGGGILYCLRYNADRLKEHHKAVVSALEANVEMEDYGDNGIGVVLKRQLTESETDNVMVLLEELSVLNEAQEYAEVGFGAYKNLQDLKNGLMGRYLSLLENREMADAYKLIQAAIPQIVRDISTAHRQNNVLSGKDKRTMGKLDSFSKNHTRILNSPEGFVLFGI